MLPINWLGLLFNKTTWLALGALALAGFVFVQNARLEHAQAEAKVAEQRAAQAEAAAKTTLETLDSYHAQVADNAQRAVAAGKVRTKTQARVVSVLSNETGQGAAEQARAAAADISALWAGESQDEK